METKWLLDGGLGEDLEPMKRAIEAEGLSVTVKPPWRPASLMDKMQDGFCDGDLVVAYGGVHFIHAVQQHTNLTPGSYCTWDNYKCTHYYPEFGPFLFNNLYRMLPFGELPRFKEILYRQYGIHGRIFIRPDSGAKPFDGGTIHKDDFDLWALHGPRPSELCVITWPKEIEFEWRLVIAGGQVLTGCRYMPDRVPGVPDDIAAYARRVIAAVTPPDPIWVLDIAWHPGDDAPYVLEIGSVSCAGLYACDRRAIVREVSAKAKQDWEDLNVE